MGLDICIIWLYEGSHIQEFNGTLTSPQGYMELKVFVGDGKDIRKINSQFLFVPCRSVYKCVIGRPFAATLNAIASPVHHKFKYHNLQGIHPSSMLTSREKKESTKLSKNIKEKTWTWRSIKLPSPDNSAGWTSVLQEVVGTTQANKRNKRWLALLVMLSLPHFY